jgi:hypothetical protein
MTSRLVPSSQSRIRQAPSPVTPPAFPPALGSPVAAPKDATPLAVRHPGSRRASLAAARVCRLEDPQEPVLTCFTGADRMDRSCVTILTSALICSTLLVTPYTLSTRKLVGVLQGERCGQLVGPPSAGGLSSKQVCLCSTDRLRGFSR